MAEVGKQRVHANFALRVEVDELGLAVLERDGIVRLHLKGAQRGTAEAEHRVISRIEQRAQQQHGDNGGFHMSDVKWDYTGRIRSRPPRAVTKIYPVLTILYARP